MHINSLVRDWAYRVNDGMPDPKNRNHLELLEDVLRDYKYSEEFIFDYISELKFKNSKAFGKYKAKHDMRKTTKVTIGGKDTTAGEADKNDDEKKPKSESRKRIKLTARDIKKQKYNDEQLSEVINNGLIPTEESGAKGGVGSWAVTKEELDLTKKFLEKRAENPDYKLEIPEYNVSEEDIDLAIETMKAGMGDAWSKFKTKCRSAGGVNSKFTTGEAGQQRFRNVIQQYLKTGGISVITGKFVNFSDMQLDHRIPYSSAKARAKENGTTVLEEQAKLDSPENWDMIESSVNQLKSSLSDSDFLERVNDKLNASSGEKEAKKIKQEFKNYRRKELRKYHQKRIENKDYSEFSEDKCNKMDSDERNTLMKAWNYYHPSTKTFNEELKKDSGYAKKLEKAGIKIVYDENKKSKANPLGFVDGEGDAVYHMTRNPKSGGNRSRGKRRPKDDEIEMIREKTQASKKFDWETSADTNSQNKLLDELREDIRKQKDDISKQASKLKKK